ncbi:GGDEF domain-containing protein [Thermomonas carbonis]|uniref:GGDEF domain-containing protein n=1 Tax=Thermomonas carbonis TaxID=1463158 RepID=UPI00188BBA2B|nr:GGDEF domain-containing protein [Thermomonas carbonis]
MLLWLLAGVAADLWLRAPVAFTLIGVCFGGLTVMRFRIRGLPDDSDENAVRGRLDFIWALLLVNAGVWGAAAAWLLLAAPEESARTVAAISSYAFATAFAHNFPMRLRHAFAAVFLIYLPTLIALVASGARYELIGVSALYLLYVSLALRRSHAEYLQRLDLEDELREQRDLFQQQSRRDGLTGLANRRRFSSALEDWSMQARTHGTPLSLLILDLDHFKAINDQHGHARGDACLREFADRLQASFAGSEELVARLGGEEFGVLLRGMSRRQAFDRAEGFRAGLAEAAIGACNGASVQLRVSVGVAAFEPHLHHDADALYHAADTALYAAKGSGRNTVMQADP